MRARRARVEDRRTRRPAKPITDRVATRVVNMSTRMSTYLPHARVRIEPRDASIYEKRLDAHVDIFRHIYPTRVYALNPVMHLYTKNVSTHMSTYLPHARVRIEPRDASISETDKCTKYTVVNRPRMRCARTFERAKSAIERSDPRAIARSIARVATRRRRARTRDVQDESPRAEDGGEEIRAGEEGAGEEGAGEEGRGEEGARSQGGRRRGATRTTTIATTGRARRRDGARDDAIEWEEYSRRASGGDGATRGGRGDGKAMDARTGTISWRYGLTRATRARDARAARGARRSRTIERERNRGRARGAGRIGGSTRAVGDAGGRDAKTTRRRETED